MKKREKFRTARVFTPGGFPTVTYVSINENELEKKIKEAEDYLSKLVVLTGSTKSGKTVLVDRVFPGSSNVWIDGGTVDSVDVFWDLALEKLNAFTDYTTNKEVSKHKGFEAEASLEGSGINKILGGRASLSVSMSKQNGSGSQLGRHVSSKVAVTEALQNSCKMALIIDDFHYIDKDIQKSIVRALKSPIMHGVPVIFIAIPNRRYDAVDVEREMTGRIENIEMPVWGKHELKEIAVKGFEALNICVSEEIIEYMADAAYGSPFLMQEFCKSMCQSLGIQETQDEKQSIVIGIDQVEKVFVEIAEHSGRPIFNRLKKGPRARTDRKPRRLKNGIVTDIYGLVMEGFKELKPGVETVNYERLRNQIKEISQDNPPQKNEISRVLDQIAKISYSDTSSTPVIDWQKEDNIITITDPFFAFFLKWSTE